MNLLKITCLIFLTTFMFSCSKKTNEVAATKTTTSMAESKESAASGLDEKSERSAEGRREGRRGGSPEDRQKRQDELYAQLNLSEVQKTKVTEINDSYRTKMQNLRRNSDGDREAMRASMMKMRDAQNAELKNIMTAEQFEKFTAIQKAQRGKRGGGRRGN